MAAPYTDTTALSRLIQTAYDRKVRLALRSTPMFRNFADTRPAQQTAPGETVVFHIHKDLAPATTPLNEINDPAGASLLNPDPVTVTLNEYGNYTVATKRLRAFALDSGLDANITNMITFNQAQSIDSLVEAVLAGGPQVIKEIASGDPAVAALTTGAGTANSTVKARDFRYAVTKLRGASVSPVDGLNYVAVVHPDVAHDLRVESDANAWRIPHAGVDTANVYAAEIGTFEGARFIEHPRCVKTGNVYRSYVLGREALAEAVADEFHVVADGVIADPLNRKMAIGWTGIAGWARFRPEALWRVETTSTI
jgi:N4-gp56 family major capsid protein